MHRPKWHSGTKFRDRFRNIISRDETRLAASLQQREDDVNLDSPEASAAKDAGRYRNCRPHSHGARQKTYREVSGSTTQATSNDHGPAAPCPPPANSNSDSGKTFRLRGIPAKWGREKVQEIVRSKLELDEQAMFDIRSFSNYLTRKDEMVATFDSQKTPTSLSSDAIAF